MDQLQFEQVEVLPLLTDVYQVEDGTLFYFDRESKRLFVKKGGREIEADLPFVQIDVIAAFRDAIYIKSDRKIYKAVASRNAVTVTFERDLLEGVYVDVNGLCMMEIERGSQYVFKMCDEFGTDGVAVAVKEEGFDQDRMHRGKVYHLKSSDCMELRTCGIGMSAVGIEFSNSARGTFARESSPFYYIATASDLLIINTETLEPVQALEIDIDMSFNSIVGVKNGKLMATGFEGSRMHVLKAQLPEGCYSPEEEEEEDSPEDSAPMETEATAPVVHTVDELLAKNMELTEQVANWKKQTVEAEKKIKKLQNLNREISAENDENAARAEELEECEEMNEYLSIEIENLKKKIQKRSATAEEEDQIEHEEMGETDEPAALQIARMEVHSSKLFQKNERLEEENATLSHNLQEAQAMITELESIIDQFDMDKKQLSKKMEKMEEEHFITLTDLKWTMANQDRTEDLNEQLEEANEQLSKENAELIKKMDQMEIENEKNPKQLTISVGLVNKLERTESRNEELEQVNAQLSNERDQLLKEKEELIRRIEKMEMEQSPVSDGKTKKRRLNNDESNSSTEEISDESSGCGDYDVIDATETCADVPM